MPTPYRQKTRSARPGIQPFMLYLLPLPLILVVIHGLANGHFGRLLFGSLSLGLIWLAGYFIRKAARAEWEAQQRRWKRSTRVPWRFSAAVFVGIAGLLVPVFLLGHNVLIGMLSGLGAFAGILARYGFDPQYSRDKEVSRFGVTTEEVLEVLDEAEGHLAQIEQASKSLRNAELKVRLGRIVGSTREVLDLIEQDPKDLSRARKFLKVYLLGARDVTLQYAKTHHHQDNFELEQNFRNVLSSIESAIDEQKKKLLENDALDLDVKIEVLETQLKHEGII